MKYKVLAVIVLVIFLTTGASGGSASAPAASSAYNQGVHELAQVVPTWQQANTSGFGDPLELEVSALEAFNGYLYAGTYNVIDPLVLFDGARIYRSPDGATWSPVTQPGFQNPHDTAPPAILDFVVFGSRLYTSTGRGGNAAQIWRSSNGTSWAPMVSAGFGDPDIHDIAALAVYNSTIYAGASSQVSGAQIFRSPTGDSNTWNLVAPAAPTMAGAGVTGFAVFSGSLWASIESEAPVQIWRSSGGAWTTVMNDGFGSSLTTSTGGMAAFGGYLYVGAGNSAVGAQLWRTNDGASWEQVISPAGFDDLNNVKVEMVFVFNNQLYVSVKNAVTGIEVWRSANGTLWEQANQDGFGDGNNSGSNRSNATAEFLGHLYVGTANAVDGGELWRMQMDAADLAVAKVDAVDPVVAGDAIAYTVTVNNLGPNPALNVSLTDNLPGGVVFTSATPDQGSCSQAGGAVTCNLGDMASGASATVSIVVTTTAPGTLTNSATATSDTLDLNPANNSASEGTTVNPAAGPQADLSIAEVDSPDPVIAGATLTYTLTIANAGPDTASDVAVTDELPAVVKYGGASGAGWSCSYAGGLVTCGMFSLAVGTAPSVVITVTAPVTSGTIANTVTVSGLEMDPQTGNNTASVVTQVRCMHCIFLPLIQR